MAVLQPNPHFWCSGVDKKVSQNPLADVLKNRLSSFAIIGWIMQQMNTAGWYAVQTKPRQERVARENLLRQDYTVYLPDLVVSKRKQKKWVDTLESLFPRYLFVQLDLATVNLAPIRSTIGVSKLVRFGDSLTSVPDEVIHFLRQAEDQAGHHIDQKPLFQRNDVIEILDGPFAGLPGVYRLPKGKDRAVILITLLGRQSEVVIGKEAIAKY